jgi:uncharacterized protein (DUF2267 family)
LKEEDFDDASRGAIMSATAQNVFRNPVAKATGWINEIAKRLKHGDKNEALQTLRAVLHALRDRLSVDEAAHLSAQLPLVIRGIFFETFRPHVMPVRGGGVDELLAEVGTHLPRLNARELKRAVQVVFDVLAHHVSSGEVEDVGHILPAELREFWTETVSN